MACPHSDFPGVKLLLDEPVELIRSHAFLQRAEILSTWAYKEWSNAILHRFLILELRRGKTSSVWLRIDRRVHPETSGVSFVFAFGQSPAYDTVGRSRCLSRFRKGLTHHEPGCFFCRQSCPSRQGAVRKAPALQQPHYSGRIQVLTRSHPRGACGLSSLAGEQRVAIKQVIS